MSSQNSSPTTNSSSSSHTTHNSSSTHSARGTSFTSSLGSGLSLHDSTTGFNPFEFSDIPYRSRDYSYAASSNYQYPPHKIRHLDPAQIGSYQCATAAHAHHNNSLDPANQSSCLTDSDASGFIYVPMAPRPVTHKDKIKLNRRKVISQGLKTIGRRIKKHGAKTLNMNTLAVL